MKLSSEAQSGIHQIIRSWEAPGSSNWAPILGSKYWSMVMLSSIFMSWQRHSNFRHYLSQCIDAQHVATESQQPAASRQPTSSHSSPRFTMQLFLFDSHCFQWRAFLAATPWNHSSNTFDDSSAITPSLFLSQCWLARTLCLLYTLRFFTFFISSLFCSATLPPAVPHAFRCS